jgi:hypothetical protein
LDHDFLLQNVERLNLETIKEAGTAIGLGLNAALNRLRDLDSKSRIVILMTDGVNNTGKVPPLTAADAAKALLVKVYTIGVGTRGMAPMPYMDAFGRRVMQMEPVEIDEAVLTEISKRTGGRYYRPAGEDGHRDEEIPALHRAVRLRHRCRRAGLSAGADPGQHRLEEIAMNGMTNDECLMPNGMARATSDGVLKSAPIRYS